MKQIYSSTPTISTSEELAKQLGKHSGSPLVEIADEIMEALNYYEVDPKLFVAVVRQDSGAGTSGKGARTKNPGNVGNTDSGATTNFNSWLEGSIAVIRNLAERKVK